MRLPNQSAPSNKFSRSAREDGVTIIEFLVALAIFVVLIAGGVLIGSEFYKSYSLNSERNVVVSILGKARNQAMANVDQAAHGVYFGDSGYTIFEGSTYTSRNQAYDEFIAKTPGFNRSGLTEVVFNQLAGDTSASGTITLTGNGVNINISLNNEGRIDY